MKKKLTENLAIPKEKRPALGYARDEAGSLLTGEPEQILEQEIALLRKSVRQMQALAEAVEDPLLAIKAFSAVGSQIVRIANLLRLQMALAGSSDDSVSQAAIEAIRQIAQEWDSAA